jgi:cysteine synthase A
MPSLHDSEDSGARFIPLIMGMGLIEGVIPITNEVVFSLVWQTAAVEELRGEALAAAVELCESLEMSGRHVVVIIPSFAERYISTPFLDKL